MRKEQTETLYDTLVAYSKKDVCPMHMPGHKRNFNFIEADLPYGIDITEIDGFDNLQNPEGILKECMIRAAKLYESEKSFYLVNGSTCGILAGIRAVTQYGDKVIMNRNCHKSVYHGIELNGLRPIFIVPQEDEKIGINCSITTEQVKKALEENEDAKLLIITSPTYEGVISDIKSIVKLAHEKGIPVLVDEAHGAHLGFSDGFYPGAIKAGADIVIHSLHKTLPALTQCALIHLNGNLVSWKKVARELTIFQTSSPSYVLMASMDSIISSLLENKEYIFSQYEKNLKIFHTYAEKFKHLSALCYGLDNLDNHNFYDFDKGKLVISTRGTNFTGVSLANLLRDEYNIEIEMSSADYIVAMTSICDSTQNIRRFGEALVNIDRELVCRVENISDNNIVDTTHSCSIPRQAYTIAEVRDKEGEYVPTKEAIGRVALEYLWAYPPGIPLLVPGEIMDEELLQKCMYLSERDVELKSTYGNFQKQIFVLKNR